MKWVNSIRRSALVLFWALSFAHLSAQSFEYDLRWGLFSAGSVKLCSEPVQIEGAAARKISLDVQTDGFMDTVYSVDNHIESTCSDDFLRGFAYRKHQREGGFKRDTSIIFDWENHALLGTNNEHRFSSNLPDKSLIDPLSALFRFRTIPELVVGKTYPIAVTDGEFMEDCQVKVICIEKVDTKAGSFECYKLKVKFDKVRGIFRKRKDASVYIWLTTDTRRLPVKLKSKASVGKFRAELVSMEGV